MKSIFTTFLLLISTLFACSASSDEPIVLSSKGVGKLLFSTKGSELPNSIEGLYDRVIIDEYEDVLDGGYVLTYTFYLGDKKVMESRKFSYDQSQISKDNPIAEVTVYDGDIVTDSGIKLKGGALQLVDKRVTHTSFQGGDYFICDGYAFLVDKMSQAFYSRIQNMATRGQTQEMVLNEFDFNEGAVIVSINPR